MNRNIEICEKIYVYVRIFFGEKRFLEKVYVYVYARMNVPPQNHILYVAKQTNPYCLTPWQTIKFLKIRLSKIQKSANTCNVTDPYMKVYLLEFESMFG